MVYNQFLYPIFKNKRYTSTLILNNKITKLICNLDTKENLSSITMMKINMQNTILSNMDKNI